MPVHSCIHTRSGTRALEPTGRVTKVAAKVENGLVGLSETLDRVPIIEGSSCGTGFRRQCCWTTIRPLLFPAGCCKKNTVELSIPGVVHWHNRNQIFCFVCDVFTSHNIVCIVKTHLRYARSFFPIFFEFGRILLERHNHVCEIRADSKVLFIWVCQRTFGVTQILLAGIAKNNRHTVIFPVFRGPFFAEKQTNEFFFDVPIIVDFNSRDIPWFISNLWREINRS
mmetsp:Transcript_18231/g.37363  ORF Transcript_18231/g.37363 Transcript_18231/m.37363 type:complete len:225 (-) Transcript_18231:720-1394(-)